MAWLWRYEFRRTTLLLVASIVLLLAIGFSPLTKTSLPLIPCIGIGCLMVVVGRYRMWGLLGVVLLAVGCGSWRGEQYVQRLAGWQAEQGGVVQLQATAAEDAVYGKHGQITFIAVQLRDLDTGRGLPGKIQLSGFGPTAVYQNDVVIASGKLYPGIGAYQGFMSYATIQVTDVHPTLIASIRRQFGAGMLSALPEPLGSFAMGLLIGQRATLPDNVKQNLLMVGLTHIIAVSGYNLTIMLEASRKLLARHSKRLSTGLTFSLMAAFVLLAGASASIVRAAIVSSLSILASYYGRRPRPLVLIMLAAAISAWANPLYVWGDTSWYLSFLAFYGIMMVSPVLQHRLPPAVEKSAVLAVGLESICAEVMTLPFVLYTFGQMSFISLPANMLVVSLTPLAMLLSLFAGLAGMFVPVLAGWIAWPAKLLLTYMLDTAQLLAHLPHIFRENVWLSLPGLVLIYAVVVAVTGLLSCKDRLKSAIITDTISERTSR